MTMFGYACDRCREKHQSCNHELPCKRCTKANSADTCHYTPKRTRSKASRLPPSASIMSSTSSSSNSNSPIRGQATAMPFHAFTQGHSMQSMHFDPGAGGMTPCSPRSPPHMAMQQQQTSTHFVPPQSPFGPGAPFVYTDASPRFLSPPPPMPLHENHHFYPGHPPHALQPHRAMANPQYHPYHAPLPPQMMMPPIPYVFVPPDRSSALKQQQGGRQTCRSALGEALSQPAKSSPESHMAGYYPQHAQLPPPPLPYPELLDGIHYATSQYYYSGHSSIPREETSGYHSMDGSALMASGVLVQEYIRDALAMMHDEGASSPATQHHAPRTENESAEAMKPPLAHTERNGPSNVQSE